MIDDGRLPALRVGRRVRILRSDLDRLLADNYTGMLGRCRQGEAIITFRGVVQEGAGRQDGAARDSSWILGSLREALPVDRDAPMVEARSRGN